MRACFYLVVFLIAANGVHAQNQDSLAVTAGFMVNPQVYMSMKNPKEGFKPFIPPVLAAVSFSKGRMTVHTVYNLNINAIALVGAYQCSSNIGVYLFQNKRVLQNGQYTSIGVTTPLANGRAFGFAEIGNSWDGYGFFMYTGVFIPFKVKIK